ncbi:MAG: type II toxin-antitoxin system Phd/YefM family antitoxin [Gammaproteobacteria bacterium]|nr:type II toxin-antitoxin system Phd/YefM family antitoxin [Gammaproteobacteria bacterium]
MKTISFTEFRKQASKFITEVENGESIVLIRRGRPVAEVIPIVGQDIKNPAWKRPGIRLRASGKNLSSVILEDREASI